MKFVYTLPVSILLWINLSAQTVYQPVQSDIYELLERLYTKGVIEYHSEIKPIPRTEIAKYLLEASAEKGKLTSVDTDEINFYRKEFADELNFISDEVSYKLPRTDFFSAGEPGRFRLFNYRDSSFIFYLDPILGIEVGNKYGSGYSHRRNGLKLYGYFLNHWGYSLDFRDNLESGNNIDILKNNVPDKGINLSKKTEDDNQYSEVNAELNYNWSIGNISFGKYPVNIGSGKAGQIINSSKAPSYPLLRLDIHPVKWMNFIYFHGWLKSNVPDSSTFRVTSVKGRENISDIPKFIASHLLSFYINQDISLSVGESVVYSGSIEPVYIVPVMFFRLADHYLSSTGSNTGDNAQLFADASYRVKYINAKIYGTIFIDELSIERVAEGENLSSIGYTAGTIISDLLIPNSSLNIEYTKLQPFVYMNSNDAQTYRSHNYQLGHWAGSNSDIFYISYKQNILRGFSIKLSGWYFRKGQTEKPEEQYQSPYPPTLYGAKRIDKNLSLSATWQPYHNLYLNGYYTYSEISDDEENRTPDFMIGSDNNFGFTLSYGF